MAPQMPTTKKKKTSVAPAPGAAQSTGVDPVRPRMAIVRASPDASDEASVLVADASAGVPPPAPSDLASSSGRHASSASGTVCAVADGGTAAAAASAFKVSSSSDDENVILKLMVGRDGRGGGGAQLPDPYNAYTTHEMDGGGGSQYAPYQSPCVGADCSDGADCVMPAMSSACEASPVTFGHLPNGSTLDGGTCSGDREKERDLLKRNGLGMGPIGPGDAGNPYPSPTLPSPLPMPLQQQQQQQQQQQHGHGMPMPPMPLQQGKVTGAKVVRLLAEFEEKGKGGEWPLSTSVHCYWCCHRFDTPPLGLPVKFVSGRFQVIGCFCSLECASAYNFSNTRDSVDECMNRYSLLNALSARLGHDRIVKPAPDRLALSIFGGHMTIEDFRGFVLATGGTRQVIVNCPPMQSVTQQVEEVAEADLSSEYRYVPLDSERVSRYQEKVRLQRTKPLVNFRNTLDHSMKLRIN